jgi:2-phospho-L-lactate guanylyltransferase
MRTAAVIPVKPLDHALGRLASVLSPLERRELQAAMLAEVLLACRDCPGITDTLVVTGDAIAAALSRSTGAIVVEDHAPPRGMNPATALGQAFAASRGMDAVLILTADLPLVSADDLDDILDALAPGEGAVLVPSRDGTGTNALAIAPPLGIATRLGPNSRELHELALLEAGISVRQLEISSLALDVDTPDDLWALATCAYTGMAAERCGAWNLAERLGAGVVR